MRHGPSPKWVQVEGRLTGRRLQARRLAMWTKDPHCAGCRTLTDYPSGFELDHKAPLHKGGEDVEDNCQVLCPGCHEAKTAKDMGHREVQAIGADGWPE